MKRFVLPAIALITVTALASCIKDEPSGTECDIIEAAIHVDSATDMFFSPSDTAQLIPASLSNIIFMVRQQADLRALAPTFRITPGATISPQSGSTHDFTSQPVSYTVTSEDGQWQRHYTVSFVPARRTTNTHIDYSFEQFDLATDGQHYYTWYETTPDGSRSDCWATGNPGFRLSMSTAQPDAYPTTPLADGYKGHAVCLTTRSTGAFGAMVNKRIAAGNLFLGSFDLATALRNALQSTRFGIPFRQKPLQLSGYYQYRPGDVFQDAKGNAVEDRTDRAAIYAVLYRNHDDQGNPVQLTGEDVQTNPHIVAKARMEQIPPTDSWTPFSVSFDYTSDIDDDLLSNYGYSLAVVFSSSADGDLFEGAVGSRLLIDEVRLDCSVNE